MKPYILLSILTLTILSCNSKTEKKIVSEENTKPIKKRIIGKLFFDYDQIDYYFGNFEDSEVNSLFDTKDKSELELLKKGILLDDIPKDIHDTIFISTLEKVGFKKSSVNKSKFSEIDSLFVEKSVNEYLATACIYVYRDILIFKKNNKVIGTAKICLGCMAHQINGTNANTENFGQDGDYEKLKELLKR
jgi:hypothetical protein